jgi:hypothetical protein
MNKFIESNGLLTGFHYHDQIIEKISFHDACIDIYIRSKNDSNSILEFKNVFNASISNFISNSIINSCFIWDKNKVPDWFRSTPHFLNATSYCSIDTTFVFLLTSSYGASLFIPFEELSILNMDTKDIIYLIR